MTPWQAWDAFPPYLVRLLAKSGSFVAMTDAEIAIGSGIDLVRVREINFKTAWRGVDTWEQRAYVAACRFDPTNPKDRRRVINYEFICTMRNAKPGAYLRRSPKWESELLPIIKMIQSRVKSAAA
jgi:hypothetical protein